MWTGKEHKDSPDRRAEARAAESEAVPAAQPRHVGILLRRAREAQNEDLRVAATHLRIRAGYLRAIEDGRFDELPSGAYALGFVRAYAIHLGLDGDKLVRRFKEETGAGLMRRPELVIPEPQGENRVPGGALVFASLLLAAGAYGGWYYVSSNSRIAEAPAVEEPPISAPARPAAIAAAPSPAAQPAATPAPARQPPAQVAVPPLAATGGIDTSFAASPRGSAPPQAAIATAAGRPQEPAKTPAVEDSDSSDLTPAPEPLKPTAKPPEPVVQQAARQAPEQPLPRPPVSASAASAATIDSAPAPAKPRPRVVIRAVADSWLQIGDGRGPAVFAQVLRAGDSFTVPDRAGLRFDTGNAGGLEITVDGQTVPPLGPSGAVRRNIPLDADKLVAGANH